MLQHELRSQGPQGCSPTLVSGGGREGGRQGGREGGRKGLCVCVCVCVCVDLDLCLTPLFLRDVDDVQDMMDDISEQNEIAEEIGNALSQPIGFNQEIDDVRIIIVVS